MMTLRRKVTASICYGIGATFMAIATVLLIDGRKAGCADE